jgi:hypothetical protein
MNFGKLTFLITFFALTIQGVFVFIDKPDELMFIPLTLILAGGGVYFLNKSSKNNETDFQTNIFLLAFSLRLLVGFILYGWDLSAAFGDEDSSGYIMGWYAAENWYRNGFDGFFSDIFAVFALKQNVGQSIIWGIPMFIAGGPSRMIVSVVNSFAGAFLVVVIYKISQKIFQETTARVAAFLVAFWASFILLSAGTSKEILVIFFEWSLLYIIIRNSKGLSLSDALFSIPLLLGLYATRFYALYMAASAFVFSTIISNRKTFVRNAVLAVVVMGSVFILLNSIGVLTRDFEKLDRQNKTIDSWRSNVAGSTGSGVEVYSEYNESYAAIPVATVYFFLAPFPWEMFSGSMRNTFAVIENLVILVILIIGFTALRNFFKEKLFQMMPILVFCILYAGFQIWGLANVGLAWRHKQTVMPLLFMLAAYSLTRTAKRFAERKQNSEQNVSSSIFLK